MGALEKVSPLKFHMWQGLNLNSHYFHIIGDGKNQPNSRGLYIPIIRIPIKGGMTIPNIATFDHGTYNFGYPFVKFQACISPHLVS